MGFLQTLVTSVILASVILAVVAFYGFPPVEICILRQLVLNWLRVATRAGAVPLHVAQDLSVCKQAECNLLTLPLGPTLKQTSKEALLQSGQIRVARRPTVQDPGVGPAGSLQGGPVEVNA